MNSLQRLVRLPKHMDFSGKLKKDGCININFQSELQFNIQVANSKYEKMAELISIFNLNVYYFFCDW